MPSCHDKYGFCSFLHSVIEFSLFYNLSPILLSITQRQVQSCPRNDKLRSKLPVDRNFPGVSSPLAHGFAPQTSFPKQEGEDKYQCWPQQQYLVLLLIRTVRHFTSLYFWFQNPEINLGRQDNSYSISCCKNLCYTSTLFFNCNL